MTVRTGNRARRRHVASKDALVTAMIDHVITAQGHSPDVAMAILTFVSAYTSGMALQGTRAVVEEYEAGLDREHWWKVREQEFQRIAAEGRYPITFSITGPPDVHAIFGLGLKHLLDGLTPLIERPADQQSPRRAPRGSASRPG